MNSQYIFFSLSVSKTCAAWHWAQAHLPCCGTCWVSVCCFSKTLSSLTEIALPTPHFPAVAEWARRKKGNGWHSKLHCMPKVEKNQKKEQIFPKSSESLDMCWMCFQRLVRTNNNNWKFYSTSECFEQASAALLLTAKGKRKARDCPRHYSKLEEQGAEPGLHRALLKVATSQDPQEILTGITGAHFISTP